MGKKAMRICSMDGVRTMISNLREQIFGIKRAAVINRMSA